MKKLYSLLSAVAVCSLNAAAVNPAVVSTMTANNKVLAESTLAQAPMKAPANAPTGAWNAIGEGTWQDDILPSISTVFMPGKSWKVNVEESATTPGWYRLQVYNENSYWYEIAEAADPNFLYINATNPDQVYFEDFVLDESYNIMQRTNKSENLVAHFNPQAYTPNMWGKLKDGIISFEKRGIFTWDGGQYASYSNQDGLTMLALPGHEITSEWAEYGTATFQNAILAPFFAETNDQLTGELVNNVQVFKGVENTNAMRFVGAWNVGGQESEWPLTIDVTTPNFVAMDMQGTGVEGDEGLLKVCGFYTFMIDYSAQPLTHEQFIVSEYKDQVIVYDAANEVVTFKKNAVMNNSPEGATPDQWGWWKDEYAFPSIMTITKTNGISNITVDNSNAPVEYYNLQGIRVENPANGIFIRRQGTLTSKVFVR